jgi:hypothetical protein
MEQNKFNKYFLILISFFVIYSCQFDWVEERHISLNKIEFGSGVRDSFKQKSLKYFSQNPSNNHHSLNISNLQFKKKNFYSGSAARAKQIEIVGQLNSASLTWHLPKVAN